MAQARRFDHVGITVADMDRAEAFFGVIGFEAEGSAQMEGEFVDTVTGLAGSRSEIRVLRLPGAETTLELSAFETPAFEPGPEAPRPTLTGLRNLCFEVDGLPGLVEEYARRGYGLVGGIGEWQGAWRMAYVRGPEGIILALAERLDGEGA